MRSRTITAPTCLRSQVARLATTWAMVMKYSSQGTRLSLLIGPNVTRIAPAPPRYLMQTLQPLVVVLQ